MFSGGPFADLPGADFPSEDSLAVDDPFASLALDPDLDLQYLVELYPYDPAYESTQNFMPGTFAMTAFCDIEVSTLGGVNMIGLGDRHFITKPTDSVPNKYFAPVVDNPLQFDVSIMRGDTLGFGAISFGSIELQNGDGELDYLAPMSFRGRRIVVRTGRVGWDYDQFVPVFDGLINGLEFNDDIITVTFRDIGLRADLEIESSSYAGTGGIEGGADLTGKMKPLLYGECFNVEPVLVDPVNLVYQIHAYAMEAVDAVYDAAVALSFDEDVADITTATPGAGEYATSLAQGMIKLGSTPAGRVTADARGDNTDGYVETVADISKRIVKTRIGYQSFEDDEIDTQSFTDLNAELSGPAGLYILERGPVRQFLDALITPCGAYWYFDRVGLLTCDFIDTAGDAEAVITDDFIDTAGVDRSVPIPAAWRISVGYAPSWTVQKEDEVAGSATEARRSFVGQEYRIVTDENQLIRESDPHSIERVFYTNLADIADAEALLERMVRIYGSDRTVYRVPVYGALYRNYLGDPLRLTYSRYGIDETLSLVGISENAERGQTIMELWG